jgi:hypothetical protein
VFENRVLRRVFGPKMDEVTREWRKLHEEELNNVYPLPNIIRVRGRGVYTVLVGKPEGKATWKNQA